MVMLVSQPIIQNQGPDPLIYLLFCSIAKHVTCWFKKWKQQATKECLFVSVHPFAQNSPKDDVFADKVAAKTPKQS